MRINLLHVIYRWYLVWCSVYMFHQTRYYLLKTQIDELLLLYKKSKS